MKPKYQILSGKEWIEVWKGEPQPSGWLHWQTRDEQTDEADTIGLAPPDKWREKPRRTKLVK